MLKQRVITAIFLIAGFLGALFLLPGWAWGLVVAAVVALGCHEWGGFVGQRGKALWVTAALAMLPVALSGWGLLSMSQVLRLCGVATAFWVCVAPWLLRCEGILRRRPLHAWALCWLVLVPAGVALVQIRNVEGPWVLLGFMAAVWLADIAAYFVGRAIGRHKLAPRISPGKSIEGAVAGIFAVVVYALCVPSGPLAVFSVMALALGAAVFAALSILGDLFESLLKRQAGLKDSGTLLPGHGGVLDRVDSLTSALPLAVLILWVR